MFTKWIFPDYRQVMGVALCSVLHHRSARRSAMIFTAMLFAKGRKTITSRLRAADINRRYKAYYYFIGSLGNKTENIATRLLKMMIQKIYQNANTVLMAKVLDPEPEDEVYDPCCGSGGLLIKCYLHSHEKQKKGSKKAQLRFYGQEILHSTFAMAKMNTFIHDMEAKIALGDTMSKPDFKKRSGSLQAFDIVTAVDTNDNESGCSVEACAVPAADGNSITLQENTVGFCNVDGTVGSDNAGYTGGGFANTDNALGNGVDWNMDVNSPGTYTFRWRYANGSTGRLYVPESGYISTYIACGL